MLSSAKPVESLHGLTSGSLTTSSLCLAMVSCCQPDVSFEGHIQYLPAYHSALAVQDPNSFADMYNYQNPPNTGRHLGGCPTSSA